MHDLGLKASIQNFDIFIRCTLTGNQPWPQFQNGIRERSIDCFSECQLYAQKNCFLLSGCRGHVALRTKKKIRCKILYQSVNEKSDE